MKETAVREPPARIAGVDARAPLFFTLKVEDFARFPARREAAQSNGGK
jgi:hypothetical protein